MLLARTVCVRQASIEIFGCTAKVSRTLAPIGESGGESRRVLWVVSEGFRNCGNALEASASAEPSSRSPFVLMEPYPFFAEDGGDAVTRLVESLKHSSAWGTEGRSASRGRNAKNWGSPQNSANKYLVINEQELIEGR